VRILLIEGDEDSAALIREKLASASGDTYDLEHTERLSAGLARLAQGGIELILLDLSLPDSHGLETVKATLAKAPQIPIIVLIGLDDNETAISAVQLGVEDFLVKGRFDTDLLARSLRYAVERKRVEELLKRHAVELSQLALTDPLTGMLNRRGLQQALSQEIQRARRDGASLFALLIDLDNFKEINDTLGMAFGDMALVDIARTLKASVRVTDRAGRIGGDEFLVLMPGIREAEMLLIAEKVRLKVSGTTLLRSPTTSIQVTASLGLAKVPLGTAALDEVLSQAGAALQRSKRAGKDQVSSDEGTGDAKNIQGREALAECLATLRRGDGLRAVRQPIFQLDEMKLVGYELLSRLKIKAFEMPEEFFPIALQANLLTSVDHQCFKTCLAAAEGLPPEARCHLNLFPTTLLNIPVASLLEAIGAQGHQGAYCIELSEQQILGEPSYLAEVVGALKEAGVRIAIDDVGFGRSSLESLLILQPDIVKIDKGCVVGIGKDPSRRRLFRRLLKVTEALGAEAIAEGIESSEDLEVLKVLGVSCAQGFLLGRPT